MNKYNNEIYKMYEEEVIKNEQATKLIKSLELEIYVLKRELKLSENKINNAVKTATKPLIDANNELQNNLSKAYEEIERLKVQINDKIDAQKNKYVIDKLTNQLNKNSSNSGIPTSKEIRKTKTGTNTYNHRKKGITKTGGQYGHKGETLTKEKLLAKINDKNVPVKQIIHYIKGTSKQKDTVKYKIGMHVNLYVEEHIFKHTKKSNDILPKEYYSDVTYNDDLKALVTTLGSYYSLGFSKVKELLYDFSNGIINISEGTIDNIYDEFSEKADGTINNITNNILNGKYQHTDETTTSENGKETYYRGYANSNNVLYKYHYHKGDAPIKDDNILTNYFGTIISDHEVGIFKYGTNNQDCIVHIGRYCIEASQNILETQWQMNFYRFLLRLDKERKILLKFNKTSFTKEEINLIEKEYDEILETAEIQNKEISSTYWKEKANTLLKRLKKYKNTILFFIHDFTIPSENNFMERCLRMIKGKTKVSGGFRSSKGGERFGNIMSIIKTAKLRKLNPLSCIREIYQGKSLFA
jgi:hypothetical protein